MADGTTLQEEKGYAEEAFGTRSSKKARKVAGLQEAREYREFREKQGDVARRAAEAAALADAMNPGGARGSMQTINVRPGMTGTEGRTAQAARAAGAGAGTAAERAAALVQQQAAGKIRELYGPAAQEAARRRAIEGLETASRPTFAENLAQQVVTGAVQQGIGAGTTLATGGIGQAAGLSPEMLRAAQGVA